MSWKKLNSRTIYENDWMQVLEDHVINPGGIRKHHHEAVDTEGDAGGVRHGRQRI